MKKLFLSLFILGLFFSILVKPVFAWDDCPLGLENDPYPGECGKYIDTNNNGVCDHSEPAPSTNSTKTDDQSKDTENSNEEGEYSVEISGSDLKKLSVREVADLWEIDANVLLVSIIKKFNLKNQYSTNNKIDDLRVEYKFSPAQIKEIAEEIKASSSVLPSKLDSNDVKVKSKNPYNFFIPFFASLVLYSTTYILSKKKKLISIKHHNAIWNTILLFLLIPSALFGFYLVLRYHFPSIRTSAFDFLFYHVEFSVAMGTIAILHLLQRLKIYFGQLKK